MTKTTLAQRAKKSLAAIALGLMLAQGLTMVPTRAKAQDNLGLDPGSGGNGSCCPSCGCVCGLNGQNYSDKVYTSGGN